MSQPQPPQDTAQKPVEAFFDWRRAAIELAIREADYRLNHDVHGDGSREAGRSWDRLRRAGDQVRSATLRGPSTSKPAPREREAVRDEIINTPETADFMAGVPIEAAHQRERWGADHDAGKGPLDWFWLIGYLAQKAATAAIAGESEKALHHTISTAAALANWHAALSGKSNAMRPGIDATALKGRVE